VTGRQFNARNAAPPECVVKLSAAVPACFKPDVWAGFVRDSWTLALHDSAARSRMERLLPPDYCAECSSDYRARSIRAGTCKPPVGANPPPVNTHEPTA
jgi:hypothetical protein